MGACVGVQVQIPRDTAFLGKQYVWVDMFDVYSSSLRYVAQQMNRDIRFTLKHI